MHIQINTNQSIVGDEALVDSVRATVEHALRHFSAKITRVEVHLSDVNGAKGGQLDQRCTLEARLQGRQPLACTAHAPTCAQAVQAASDKLVSLLATELGRKTSGLHAQGPAADGVV